MDANEQYVRKRLTEDYIEQMWHEIECDDFWRCWPNKKKSPQYAKGKWAAIRAFAEQREQQIAEVEENCDVLAEYKEIIVPEAGAVLARILAVEQERLKALRVGWKV
jgi:hypothetical protein